MCIVRKMYKPAVPLSGCGIPRSGSFARAQARRQSIQQTFQPECEVRFEIEVLQPREHGRDGREPLRWQLGQRADVFFHELFRRQPPAIPPLRERLSYDVRGEGIEGVRTIELTQPSFAEHLEHDLDDGDRLRRADPSRREQRQRVGMTPEDVAIRMGGMAQPRAPVPFGGDLLELGEDRFLDEIEQGLLVLDVPVQRHGFDPERGAEAPHRQGFEAFLVDDVECALDDPVTGQRATAP